MPSPAEDRFYYRGRKIRRTGSPQLLREHRHFTDRKLDVLGFVYRHGASLTSADQIARLIGYESAVVSGALDRLEREKLIERSQPSQGVRFYRILASTDAARQGCVQQLVILSRTRAGRVLLAKQLKPMVGIGPTRS